MLTDKEYHSLTRTSWITTYSCKHEGTLIVLGSAEGGVHELGEVREHCPDCKVATVGHAAGMSVADFVVSDHYEVHEELRRLQEEIGGNGYTTHATYTGKAKNYPQVDYWWNWPRPSCTSMWTAIRIGIYTGFDRIILCGCPLSFGNIQHPSQIQKDGDVWPPPRDLDRLRPKPGCETSEDILQQFRMWFVAQCMEFKGRVFSMSGFTKDVLGAPPDIEQTKNTVCEEGTL